MEIVTETDINATPEEVWTILADIGQWANWSPIINQSKGKLAPGEVLELTMAGKAEGQNGPAYKPVVIDVEANKRFCVRAKMIAGFLFTNEKEFELEATDKGTHLFHREIFKGWLVPVFCSQMEKGVPGMLNAMNKALKDKVEYKQG